MANHPPETEHSTTHHIVPTRVYYGVFAALLVLTGVTTWIAYIDLGRFNIYVALTIAVIKASLVMLFFMHVRYSSKLTKVIVASGVFWLMIMFLMTMSDLATRGWMRVPGR
ncbi:MAG TPA: oxidase [Solibacterales bacterium]|nr:oxidase [Bryobacterales bacterium]